MFYSIQKIILTNTKIQICLSYMRILGLNIFINDMCVTLGTPSSRTCLFHYYLYSICRAFVWFFLGRPREFFYLALPLRSVGPLKMLYCFISVVAFVVFVVFEMFPYVAEAPHRVGYQTARGIALTPGGLVSRAAGLLAGHIALDSTISTTIRIYIDLYVSIYEIHIYTYLNVCTQI